MNVQNLKLYIHDTDSIKIVSPTTDTVCIYIRSERGELLEVRCFGKDLKIKNGYSWGEGKVEVSDETD